MFSRVILLPLVAGFLAGAVWGVNLDLNRPIVVDDPRTFITTKVAEYRRTCIGSGPAGRSNSPRSAP